MPLTTEEQAAVRALRAQEEELGDLEEDRRGATLCGGRATFPGLAG